MTSRPLEKARVPEAEFQSRPRFQRRAPQPAEKRARPSSGKVRQRSGVLTALAGLLAAWALAASWVAFQGRRSLADQVEHEAELQRGYEAKVKALTRRLVGVASHQSLEHDGLEDRMADLITRQVELENRQATLTVLTEQAALAPALPAQPSGAAPAAKAAPDPAAATPPTRTRSTENPPATPNRPSAPERAAAGADQGPDLMRITPEDLMGTAGRASDHRPLSAIPLREQFARLEASMRRVGAAQIRSLDGLARMSQGQAALIRTTLADLGLDPEKLVPGGAKPLLASVPKPVGGKAADPFESGVENVRRGLAQLALWKPLADSVPLRRPVEGDNNLTSNFGLRSDPFTGATKMHAGMDFRGPIGTPVHATGAGRVITAEVTGGYGNLVEIDHGHGVVTRYGHLSEIKVVHGQNVEPGTVVGLVGTTGRSTGPHLHYETRLTGTAVDPVRFLKAGAKLFAQADRAVVAPETIEALPPSDSADD